MPAVVSWKSSSGCTAPEIESPHTHTDHGIQQHPAGCCRVWHDMKMLLDWVDGRVAERATNHLVRPDVRASEAGTSSAGIRFREPTEESREKPTGWQVDGARSRSGADGDL